MSTRERAFLVLGVIGALLLVLYPLAYRLSSEQANTTAGRLGTASPSRTPTAAEMEVVRATEASWHADATKLRGANGGAFTFDCLRGGSLNPVWGTDVYTDDSSVCTAAVHAGLITFDDGGVVVIRIRHGQNAYVGTTRNGVRTSGFEQSDGSFEFVTD